MVGLQSFLRCFLLLLAGQAPLTHVVGTCYRYDDHLSAGKLYASCNGNADVSMCWRIQPGIFDEPPDLKCLDNGLAMNNNSMGITGYWRQQCTDQSWTSPYCLTASSGCGAVSVSWRHNQSGSISDIYLQDINGNVQVTPCGDALAAKWCCGGANTTCCGKSDEEITIAATLGPGGPSGPTSATSSTSTPTATQDANVINSPTPIPTSKSSNGLSTGAKAGIAIAVVAAVAMAVVIVWLLIEVRRRKRQERKEPTNTDLDELRRYREGYKIQQPEVTGTLPKTELPGYRSSSPVEIHGSSSGHRSELSAESTTYRYRRLRRKSSILCKIGVYRLSLPKVYTTTDGSHTMRLRRRTPEFFANRITAPPYSRA